MPERPPWLKVVGGKDHVPEPSEQEGKVEKPKSGRPATPGELIELWASIGANLPANYIDSTKEVLVQQAAAQVKGWTVPELHAYLSRSDIWHKPSFTRAVLEEVAARYKNKNYDPTE